MDTPTRLSILEIAGRLDAASSDMETARADRDRLIREHHARGNVSSAEQSAAFHDACARFFSARSRVNWLSIALETLSREAA